METIIVGLGLIGGSVARRLNGFHNTYITGIDKDKKTLELALTDGVIDEGCTASADAVKTADFIILCLYPKANIEFIRENLPYLKKGCVITDVSGVKGYMVSELSKILPDYVDYVGGHPMAGREVGGYQSSTDTLFDKASFLLTPTAQNKPESVALVREMAEYIGCAHVVTTTPPEHDAMIAYTSQLMHVVAVALCDNPVLERSAFFSAGSLRDCTRVANINEVMWSELFLENKEQLTERIAEMQNSLQKIRSALEENDEEKLQSIMKYAKGQKLKWLME